MVRPLLNSIVTSVESGHLRREVHEKCHLERRVRRRLVRFGITRVANQITVDPNAATRGTAGTIEDKTKEGAEKTKEGAKKVGEATKEGAKTAAEKTKEGVTKVGSEITDAYILTRVKSRFLGEDLLKGSDINVDCDAHVVTLRGSVKSPAARLRAAELAKTTEGVKSVVNNLVVEGK